MTRISILSALAVVALCAAACGGKALGPAGVCDDPLLLTAVECTDAGNTWTCQAQPSCEGGVPTSYPLGPYATSDDPVGEKVANHRFTTPDGGTLDLADLRSAGDKTLLLISTTAGWCTACVEEQPKLEAFYRQYGCDGLEVLVAIFEDSQTFPATAALAKEWQLAYDLSFPVVADPENLLSAYYDKGAAPLNMLVDLCTMEVLYSGVGFDQSAVAALIEAHL